MYLSGYTACMSLRGSSMNLARCTIGPMLIKSIQTGELLPAEAAELVRLIKLFYFLATEHMRSSEGTESWEWCQHIAYAFATEEEIAELVREHGVVQPDDERRDVLGKSANDQIHQKKSRSDAAPLTPARPGKRLAPRAAAATVEAEARSLGSSGRMVDTFTYLKENKDAGEKRLEDVLFAKGDATEDRHPGISDAQARGRWRKAATAAIVTTRKSGTAATYELLGTKETQFVVNPTRAKATKVIVWLNTLSK